ncbi:hypothetical protein B0A49_09267, partial [Cryomyces minteri]
MPPSSISVHELKDGWTVKQTDAPDSEWLSCAVPTNVHLDLIAHKKIPDPFIGFKELDVEWVGEKSWTYKIVLPKVEASRPGTVTVLAFDGLDTFATVKLNDKEILKSDNMFVSHRVDLTKAVKVDGDNVLEIKFEPALFQAREIQKQHPDHAWHCMNGEPARLTTRKAQYHWGWDWGPVLMTCGPWKDVRLETYSGRLADLWVDIDVKESLKSAKVTAQAQVEGNSGDNVSFTLSLAGKTISKSFAEVGTNQTVQVEFNVDSPALWYPNGYGTQPLYEISATLSSQEKNLHTVRKHIGLRRVKLVQDIDKHGKSFYFRVNNLDIFCGGSNWIPADNFTPRITDDRYKRWLELMVDGNQ